MTSTRTVHDPFLGQDVEVSNNLCDRLRGKYASGPTMPSGEPEFGWRQFETPPVQHEAAAEIERLRALVAQAVVASDGDIPPHARPHPKWVAKPDDRHPQRLEEWDFRADPVGGAFERSLRRLHVATDWADPRVPDQMALVLRIDLMRLMGDWHHKHAAWASWREKHTVSDERAVQIAMGICNGKVSAVAGASEIIQYGTDAVLQHWSKSGEATT